jgi:Fe-S oxidoreductase
LTAPDPRAALASNELYQALDLCLACKGCRSECPANVDMARLKAEFLHHYHAQHGIPWRARFFGHIEDFCRAASLAPDWANTLLACSAVKSWLGLHVERELPRLAAFRFSRWFNGRRPEPTAGRRGRVVLLNDVFTEFFEPENGQAAVEVLERFGFEVSLSRCLSLGRARISQGLLREARATLERALDELSPYAARGIPLVGLEPSECLTLRDEAADLVRGGKRREQVRLVGKQVYTFEEFMAEQEEAFDVSGLNAAPHQVLLHMHCHQRSLAGVEPSLKALRLVSGAEVELVPAGCCGMAGSFGFEAEHYGLSRKIGELVLLPAVRESSPEMVIVATGASCRQQIRDGTGRVAWHPARFFQRALRGNDC